MTFNGVSYPVFYYGIDHCSFYEDLEGQEHLYTAPMLHLFGEMDLPLDMTWEQARDIANHCAGCCGYGASWSAKNRTVNVYGDDKAYKVTYAETGGISNVDDITFQARIEALERSNATWADCIRRIVEYGQPISPYGIADYQMAIDENNARIAKLKEQINAN